MQTLGALLFPCLDPGRHGDTIDLIGLGNGLDGRAGGTQQQTMGAAPSAECGILLHRLFSEFTLLVGQRLHISHDHHLIRSWGIRHEKRFDVDEVLYQLCVKKLLVWYLCHTEPGSILSAIGLGIVEIYILSMEILSVAHR